MGYELTTNHYYNSITSGNNMKRKCDVDDDKESSNKNNHSDNQKESKQHSNKNNVSSSSNVELKQGKQSNLDNIDRKGNIYNNNKYDDMNVQVMYPNDDDNIHYQIIQTHYNTIMQKIFLPNKHIFSNKIKNYYNMKKRKNQVLKIKYVMCI